MDKSLEYVSKDMYLYARTGKTDKLAVILDEHPGVLDTAKHLSGLLSEAATMGQPTAVELLLKRGADCNARGSWGSTPLMLAAHRGSLPSVILLLNAGADPNACDSDGKTALDHAKGGRTSEVEDLLTQHTRDPWEGSDISWIKSYDQKLATKVLRFIRSGISLGEAAIIQPYAQDLNLPDWYARLISTLPFAGIAGAAKGKKLEYQQWTHFMTVDQMKETMEEEFYLKEEFETQGFCAIAEADDGNYWILETKGTHESPVHLWDHSGARAMWIYSSFTSFLRSLKFRNQN